MSTVREYRQTLSYENKNIGRKTSNIEIFYCPGVTRAREHFYDWETIE